MSASPPADWADSDIVLISALQHWSYCPRQCALIHIDRVWDENLYTLRGRAVHQLVDHAEGEWDEGVRVERSLPLWSARLGLAGKADVIEFRDGAPFPVEYKHGPRRHGRHDELQLVAQALCLEEMFGRAVPCGAIYHHGSRRRRVVTIGPALRAAAADAVAAVRAMLRSGRLPAAVNDRRCDKCSLRESCLPAVTDSPGATGRAARALRSLYVMAEPPVAPL